MRARVLWDTRRAFYVDRADAVALLAEVDRLREERERTLVELRAIRAMARPLGERGEVGRA